jgi:hypothetical protein
MICSLTSSLILQSERFKTLSFGEFLMKSQRPSTPLPTMKLSYKLRISKFSFPFNASNKQAIPFSRMKFWSRASSLRFDIFYRAFASSTIPSHSTLLREIVKTSRFMDPLHIAYAIKVVPSIPCPPLLR